MSLPRVPTPQELAWEREWSKNAHMIEGVRYWQGTEDKRGLCYNIECRVKLGDQIWGVKQSIPLHYQDSIVDRFYRLLRKMDDCVSEAIKKQGGNSHPDEGTSQP